MCLFGAVGCLWLLRTPISSSFGVNDPWVEDHIANLWRLISALKDGGAKGLATFVQTAKLEALFKQIC